MDVLAGVLKEEPTPIIEHIDNVPPGLEKVLKKMLSKDKDERYLSSSDMITDLKNLARSLQSNSDAILDYETRISQHKQPTLGFLKKWISSIVVTPIRNVRRKRGFERILALRYVFALFVATVTLGLVVTWSINRLSRPSIYKSSYKPNPAALAEYEKGVNAIFANDLYKANEALDRAVRYDNRFVLAQMRFANVLKDLEQPSASIEVLVKNIESLVGHDNSLSLDEIDKLYFSALAQSLNGDHNLAAATFSRISHLTPDRPEIYLDLGLAYERWGDLERAISSYLTATRLEPESAVGLLNPAQAAGFLHLAIARGKKNDVSGANHAFDNADYWYQKNGLERTEIFYQRSALSKRLNRLREARNYGKQALQLALANGNSVQTIRCYFLLACIFYAEGKKEGVEYERQAISLAESTHRQELVPRGLIEIGETFQRNQKLSEARARFQSALAKAQSANSIYRKKNALHALAELHIKAKRWDEAIPFLKEAERIEFPNYFSPEILSRFIGKP